MTLYLHIFLYLIFSPLICPVLSYPVLSSTIVSSLLLFSHLISSPLLYSPLLSLFVRQMTFLSSFNNTASSFLQRCVVNIYRSALTALILSLHTQRENNYSIQQDHNRVTHTNPYSSLTPLRVFSSKLSLFSIF